MKQRFQETLGQYLRRERESRQIPLPELSRTTRISLPFLKALEEDNLDFFSQHEFIPGFLKLYARHLGLDAQEVLLRYEFQSELHRQKKTFQQLPLFLDYNSPIKRAPGRNRDPGKKIRQKILWGSALIIVLGLFLYTHLLSEKDRDPAPPGPSLSTNIGQEQPGEKRVALFPAGPPAKESRPSSGPDRAERGLPAKESMDPPKGDPPEKSQPAEEQKGKVIGNRDSKRYHLPGMKYYDKVLTYHRVEFRSEQEALRAGYQKAKQ
jgi:cytoskeleton protein RodZ